MGKFCFWDTKLGDVTKAQQKIRSEPIGVAFALPRFYT
jgi:hypothetical protein